MSMLKKKFEDGRVRFDPKDDRVKQSMKDECDINNIVRKWQQSGVLPIQSLMKNPQYGDFSRRLDFMEALNIVNVANTQFSKLPVEVRKQFHYDVELFLEFMADKANRDELVKSGIIKKEDLKKAEDKVVVVKEEVKKEEPVIK